MVTLEILSFFCEKKKRIALSQQVWQVTCQEGGDEPDGRITCKGIRPRILNRFRQLPSDVSV
jgi:hypothetical protein